MDFSCCEPAKLLEQACTDSNTPHQVLLVIPVFLPWVYLSSGAGYNKLYTSESLGSLVQHLASH